MVHAQQQRNHKFMHHEKKTSVCEIELEGVPSKWKGRKKKKCNLPHKHFCKKINALNSSHNILQCLHSKCLPTIFRVVVVVIVIAIYINCVIVMFPLEIIFCYVFVVITVVVIVVGWNRFEKEKSLHMSAVRHSIVRLVSVCEWEKWPQERDKGDEYQIVCDVKQKSKR